MSSEERRKTHNSGAQHLTLHFVYSPPFTVKLLMLIVITESPFPDAVVVI